MLLAQIADAFDAHTLWTLVIIGFGMPSLGYLVGWGLRWIPFERTRWRVAAVYYSLVGFLYLIISTS